MRVRWCIAVAAAWIGCARPDDARIAIYPGRTIEVAENEQVSLLVVVENGASTLVVNGDDEDLLRLHVDGGGASWTLSIHPRCDAITPELGSARRLVELSVVVPGRTGAARLAVEIVAEPGAACEPSFVAWRGDCTQPPAAVAPSVVLPTAAGPDTLCVAATLPDPSRPVDSMRFSALDDGILERSASDNQLASPIASSPPPFELPLSDVANLFRGRSLLAINWTYAAGGGGTQYIELVAGVPGDAVFRPISPIVATEFQLQRVTARVSHFKSADEVTCLHAIGPVRSRDLVRAVDGTRLVTAAHPACDTDTLDLEILPPIDALPLEHLTLVAESCTTTGCSGDVAACCEADPVRRAVIAERTVDVVVTSVAETAVIPGLPEIDRLACAALDGQATPAIVATSSSTTYYFAADSGRFLPLVSAGGEQPRGLLGLDREVVGGSEAVIVGTFASAPALRRFVPDTMAWQDASTGTGSTSATSLGAVAVGIAEEALDPIRYVAAFTNHTSPANLRFVCVTALDCEDVVIEAVLRTTPSETLLAVAAMNVDDDRDLDLVLVVSVSGGNIVTLFGGSNVALRVLKLDWTNGVPRAANANAPLTDGGIKALSFVMNGVKVAAVGRQLYVLAVRGVIESALLRFSSFAQPVVELIDAPGFGRGLASGAGKLFAATKYGTWEYFEQTGVANWLMRDPVLAEASEAGVFPDPEHASYGELLAQCAAPTPSFVLEVGRGGIRWARHDITVDRFSVEAPP